MRERTLVAAGVAVLCGVVVGSQEPIDTDMNWRIPQEATAVSGIPSSHSDS